MILLLKCDTANGSTVGIISRRDLNFFRDSRRDFPRNIEIFEKCLKAYKQLISNKKNEFKCIIINLYSENTTNQDGLAPIYF